MDYTYLDYFNYYLKEYLSELVNTFPETRDPILANYRPLLEGTNDKNDIYAKCYYTKINNYLTQIAKKDETLFETTGKIFIEGVDLYSIWNHSDATPENRTAIWKYLQILMILGRKIMPNHKEIVDILNKVSNGDVLIPAKVEQTLATKDTDEVEDTPGVFGLGDIASSLGGLSSLASGLGLGGSGSGGGGGLSGLMSSLGLGGGSGGEGGGLGGLGDIGNLMNGVKDMFTNPEFTNAMNQLSQQFTPQGQDLENPARKSSSNSDNAGEGGEGGEGCEGSEGGEDDCCEHHKSQMNADGSSTAEANTAPNGMPSMFNNPLFSELASEIGSTFDFAEMEKDGKPQNIGDALGRFMSGNNPAKLMELVGKFGSKLQNEVKNGNINPADLLKQTMSAAGGPQNLEKMMSDPKLKARMSQMQAQQNQGQNATRDRLRAKLEKKNAEK
jgi:hypothetical protein